MPTNEVILNATNEAVTSVVSAGSNVVTNVVNGGGRFSERLSADTIAFFQQTVWNNTILDYTIALGVLILLIILVIIFSKFVIAKLKKLAARTDTLFDDVFVELIEKNTFPLLYYGALYVATRSLNLSAVLSKTMNIIGVLLLTVFMIKFITTILRYILKRYIDNKETDPSRRKTIRGLLPALNVVIWIIGIVFLMGNLGFDISAVVTGLGIGGIAVALAAQALLGDFFSYFSILFDRPFELGDFIIVDDLMGSVEYIGIKTTRIRSLSGEQIIMSNTDLTGSRVKNYKRMETRRINFKVDVTYNTAVNKLKVIPAIIKNAVEAQDTVRFDRAHLASFAESALQFDVVYYVLNGDYNKYMDIQQQINLILIEQFNKEGIEFAFPTHTIHMEK